MDRVVLNLVLGLIHTLICDIRPKRKITETKILRAKDIKDEIKKK